MSETTGAAESGGNEPRWLTETQVEMLHAASLDLFGGLPGLRDRGLLQGAIARAQHLYAYGESHGLFELAAAYGHGIAKNHAFVDGNKRAALLSIRAFLFSNGYRFEPDETEAVMMMEGVADGAVDQATLADWIGKVATPKV